MTITTLIILGPNGMLGNYIKKYFQKLQKINVVCIDRTLFDVLNDDIFKLEEIIKPYLNNETLVFNCIGIIPQASKNHELTNTHYIKINKEFPHNLSAMCNKYEMKLIHPSTDCVFSGKRGKYVEHDVPDEIGIYGKTKFLGEPQNCMVIRTSIIGEEVSNKISFVEWVKSNVHKEINGYINHYWSGITCLQYAKIIEQIINENIFWTGVRHIGSEIVSKYDVCGMINDVYKLNIKINKFETDVVDKSLSSIYENLFNIPNLKQQIYEMREFSNTLYDNAIPKVFYAYWDGSQLSYLQYLTIVTFQEFNPGWKIVIYMPIRPYPYKTWISSEQKAVYTGKNYLDELFKLDIEIRKIDFETIGFKNEIPEVIKSDYLRYWILGNYGGLWSDMDIVYINPIDNIFNNNPQILGSCKVDTVICHFNDHYPIGLLMSTSNNPYFISLQENARTYLDLKQYQSIGCHLLKKLYNNPINIKEKYPNSNVLVMSDKCYLPYEWNKINDIFVNNLPDRIMSCTVGIHWFNGSNISVGYENLIDQGKFPKGGSIYPYVQKYLNVFTVSNTNNIIINNITTSYKNHLLANYKVLYKVKNILETMDKNYFDLTLINGKVIDNDTISIVMTACNRSKQTYYTLSTINNSSYKNIQIILVDDSTHDPILIRKLQEYNMHIELINIKNKFWVNPCVNYNIGLKHARGGKVIIQNAEVCYVKGDILSYVAHNVKNNEYHSFNIYALDNIEQNNLLYEDNTNPETRLKGMWYQHPAHRNAYYHFLVAMTIDTFKKVGGFDIDYSIGVDFDDNGLVHRVRGSGIKLVNVGESFMGVHLWHAQSSCGSQSSNVSNQHLFMVKHNYYDKYKIFLDLTLFPEDVVVHIINSMF